VVAPPPTLIVVEFPEQIDVAVEVMDRVGVGTALIVIIAVSEQVRFEPVTVYVVVIVGEATTFIPVVAFKPFAGLQV
jgi:hypothetical protein